MATGPGLAQFLNFLFLIAAGTLWATFGSGRGRKTRELEGRESKLPRADCSLALLLLLLLLLDSCSDPSDSEVEGLRGGDRVRLMFRV